MLIVLTTPVSNICSILPAMKFGERIERALQEMQWGPKDLEQRTGVADSTISALTRRGSDRTNYKEAIIKGFPPERINHEWLRNEVGSMTQPAPASGLSNGRLIPIELENNPAYPPIRRVNLKAQAGVSGYAVEYIKEDDGDPIVFRASWYKLKGYNPEKLFAVRVIGQSMRPKYSEGDIVVINTENNTPKDGLIYLVSYEGEFTLKRLIRDAGEWWLTSDNPDQRRYPRKACNEHTNVIGKVVYQQTDNTDD